MDAAACQVSFPAKTCRRNRSAKVPPTGDGSLCRLDLRVIGGGKPQPVAHDGSADAGADVVVRELVAPNVVEPGPLLSGQAAIGEEGEHVPLERVAARVGHRVHQAPDRPAVARVVSALLHLDAPHEVVGQDESGDHSLEVVVRDVEAVDEVGVLEPRGPADVHRVARVVARVRVRQECDDGAVITADRQGVVGSRVHVGSDRRARGIDREPPAAHDDLP